MLIPFVTCCVLQPIRTARKKTLFVLIVHVVWPFWFHPHRQQKKTLACVSSSWLRDIWALPHISQVLGVKISPKTETNQTCSFDRVQEIKVYISFCVLCVSKLSVWWWWWWLGGRGGGAASVPRLGLISAACSGAATGEEATYIIFVLLGRLCTRGCSGEALICTRRRCGRADRPGNRDLKTHLQSGLRGGTLNKSNLLGFSFPFFCGASSPFKHTCVLRHPPGRWRPRRNAETHSAATCDALFTCLPR